MYRREEILDPHLLDIPPIECLVGLPFEPISVKYEQRVFRFRAFQGVVEGEEAGEVVVVCEKGGPDCGGMREEVCGEAPSPTTPIFPERRSVNVSRK